MLFCGGNLGTAGVNFVDRETVEEKVSDNGAVTLSWEGGEGMEVVLQQGVGPSFDDARTRYQGPDSGAVLTGLPEGIHYFRIGIVETGEWSPPLKVEVTFFDRSALLLLLAIGGVVVCSTIGTIVAGHLRTRDREGAGS